MNRVTCKTKNSANFRVKPEGRPISTVTRNLTVTNAGKCLRYVEFLRVTLQTHPRTRRTNVVTVNTYLGSKYTYVPSDILTSPGVSSFHGTFQRFCTAHITSIQNSNFGSGQFPLHFACMKQRWYRGGCS